jgi:hypothetical protein
MAPERLVGERLVVVGLDHPVLLPERRPSREGDPKAARTHEDRNGDNRLFIVWRIQPMRDKDTVLLDARRVGA